MNKPGLGPLPVGHRVPYQLTSYNSLYLDSMCSHTSDQLYISVLTLDYLVCPKHGRKRGIPSPSRPRCGSQKSGRPLPASLASTPPPTGTSSHPLPRRLLPCCTSHDGANGGHTLPRSTPLGHNLAHRWHHKGVMMILSTMYR
jgi:hypothetical protein